MMQELNLLGLAIACVLALSFVLSTWIYWAQLNDGLFWLDLHFTDFKLWVRRRLDKLPLTIVWLLPRWIVKWSFIRVVAHGTTGKYSATNTSEVRAMTILKRWEADHE